MTTSVRPESLTTDVRGLRLRYLDWGNADAPPLLLLHGLSGTALYWQRVAERFAPANHVIALDQRGHGESQWAPAADGYGTDDFVADVEAFVDGLGFERFVLVGHSMGGHGALILALRHPGRFRSVSAFSPVVNPMNCPWGQQAFNAYLGDDQSRWRQYDACELVANGASRQRLFIDQGEADQFLEEQLQPERLEAVCEEHDHPLTLRRQPGYDHSYFFIASFIEDHLRYHADHLMKR